eukprot:15325340-Alexandrium_andersonii.AAC.1
MAPLPVNKQYPLCQKFGASPPSPGKATQQRSPTSKSTKPPNAQTQSRARRLDFRSLPRKRSLRNTGTRALVKARIVQGRRRE